MNKQVEDYYDRPLFGELLTITKTGILNVCQIALNPSHDQLIHDGSLYYQDYYIIEYEDNEPTKESIDMYDAVYYNGVQIVHKGKLFIGG